MALTGEITLRGKLLRVDGLKQKCLAAHRAGIKHVILPRQNEPDLAEIPARIREEIAAALGRQRRRGAGDRAGRAAERARGVTRSVRAGLSQ